MSLPAGAIIEVRTTGSDTQCAGGFNSARSGTDYSQQDTAQATGTVTSSTTTVTATTGIFTSGMVGNYITDGTTTKEITAFTSTTVVTVDSAPSWTAATIYVGGALKSPGKAGAIHVGGNKIYVKSGTYSITSASTNVAGGCLSLSAGSDGATLTQVIGYGSARDDGGTKPVLQASGISTATLVALGGSFTAVENICVDGAGLTSLRGINTASAATRIYNCKAINCTNRGIISSSVGCAILWCETSGCSTQPSIELSSPGGVVAYCYAHGNTVTGISISGGDAITTRCISTANTGASSDGIAVLARGVVDACTTYGNGRDGVRITTSQIVQMIGSIAYSNTGTGFNADASTRGCLLLNCFYGSNGTNVSSNITRNISGVTLTADPFTNKSGGDFSLNNTAGGGAAIRGAGFPGAFPAATTTGYADGGAVQHQDSGGTAVTRAYAG